MLSVLRSYGTFNRDLLEIFKWVRLIETVRLRVLGLWTLGLYRLYCTIFWNSYISDCKQCIGIMGRLRAAIGILDKMTRTLFFIINSLLDTKVTVLEWNQMVPLIETLGSRKWVHLIETVRLAP